MTEFSRTFIPQDGKYAGIISIRETDCIPEDFNLLDQPPIPGEAFACVLRVKEVSYWYDPETDPFPFYEVRWEDGAVPVWFVKWSELKAAIADDELTIGELEQLPSLLEGFAGEYDAEIVNSNRDNIPPYSELLAKGRLEDGRQFYFYVTEHLANGVNLIDDIKIRFH